MMFGVDDAAKLKNEGWAERTPWSPERNQHHADKVRNDHIKAIRAQGVARMRWEGSGCGGVSKGDPFSRRKVNEPCTVGTRTRDKTLSSVRSTIWIGRAAEALLPHRTSGIDTAQARAVPRPNPRRCAGAPDAALRLSRDCEGENGNSNRDGLHFVELSR